MHLLGIAFEPPDIPTEYEWDTVAMCAVGLSSVGGKELEILARLSDWPRACAASKMYRACIEGVTREAKRKKSRGDEYDANVTVALRRLLEAAYVQEKITCKTAPTTETAEAIAAIMGRWSAQHETP